jgi:hypothetical protein
MATKLKYVIIISISIGIGVMFGLWLKPNPLAAIDISNVSSKVVTSVTITNGMTSYIVTDIEPGMNKSVNVFVAGEAGYSIRANFITGDTLASFSYIETGNKLKETINDSGIVSSIVRR